MKIFLTFFKGFLNIVVGFDDDDDERTGKLVGRILTLRGVVAEEAVEIIFDRRSDEDDDGGDREDEDDVEFTSLEDGCCCCDGDGGGISVPKLMLRLTIGGCSGISGIPPPTLLDVVVAVVELFVLSLSVVALSFDEGVGADESTTLSLTASLLFSS